MRGVRRRRDLAPAVEVDRQRARAAAGEPHLGGERWACPDGPAAWRRRGRSAAAASSRAIMRDVRAIGWSRVGDPRSARSRGCVPPPDRDMRGDGPPAGTAPHPARGCVPAARAGSGARGAALARRASRSPSSFPAFVEPAAGATDADGNSIAVWIDQDTAPGAVLSVYRPRGGPWETATVDLETAFRPSPAWRRTPWPSRAARSSSCGTPTAPRTATRSSARRPAPPAGSGPTEEVARPRHHRPKLVGGEHRTAASPSSRPVVSGVVLEHQAVRRGATRGETQAVGIGTVDRVGVTAGGSAVAVSTGVVLPRCCRASGRSYRSAGRRPGASQETVASSPAGAPSPGSRWPPSRPPSTPSLWGPAQRHGRAGASGRCVHLRPRARARRGAGAPRPRLVADLPADQPGCQLRLLRPGDGRRRHTARGLAADRRQRQSDRRRAPQRRRRLERPRAGERDGQRQRRAVARRSPPSGVPVVAWSSQRRTTAPTRTAPTATPRRGYGSP